MPREEVMDEVWMSSHHGTFDPIEEVTIIPHDQVIDSAAFVEKVRPEPYRSGSDPAGAAEIPKLKRVVTADDLHQQRIDALEDALKAAHDFLTLPRTGAKAWASDLRYAEAITVHIEDAADAVTSALRLIDIQESR